MEAALGSSTLDKGAYTNSVLSEPFGRVPCKFGPHPGVLQPIGTPVFDAQKRLLKCDAQLLRDFAGGRAGETVHVELNLFGTGFGGGSVWLKPAVTDHSVDCVEPVWMPVQLLLGRTFSDAAALEKFLRVDPAAHQAAE